VVGEVAEWEVRGGCRVGLGGDGTGLGEGCPLTE